MQVQNTVYAEPTVYVAATQEECLNRLAEQATTDAAELLRRELARAVIVSDDEAPRNFVQLNSLVEYEDLLSGQIRTIKLVEPQDADIDKNLVSVVTPVGAALLGLQAGASFSWVTDEGRPRVLIIRRVVSRR